MSDRGVRPISFRSGQLVSSGQLVWVLDRLTIPKAPIDTVRRHGAEEFHGSSMEESEKAKFLLEKLERVLEEVRCPPDQRASCAVSLLQGEAYDWWNLVLKSPRIPNPMTWEFFVQDFRAKYVTEMYRDSKWKQFLNLKQRSLSVAEYEKEFSHFRLAIVVGVVVAHLSIEDEEA